MKYNLLQFVAAVALSALVHRCGGEDLRPAEHGLEYQAGSSPPPQNGEAQEMLSFFGASTTKSSPSTVQLPEAKNISDTWLSSHAGGERARKAGKDHVKLGLVVASAAFTLTGVVLLAISGVVFLYRLRKQETKTESISSTSALTSLPKLLHAQNNIPAA